MSRRQAISFFGGLWLAMAPAALAQQDSDAAPASVSSTRARPAASTEQITVRASKRRAVQNELTQAVTIITARQISQQAQTDLIDVLKQQPGLVFSTGGTPGTFVDPRLRGFSDSILYVFDGITLNGGGSGGIGYLLGQIDPTLLERVEVLRGPRATLYGADTTAGVIALDTRTGDTAQTTASFEGGTLDTKKARLGTQNVVDLGPGVLRYAVDGSWIDTGGVYRYEFVRNVSGIGNVSYTIGQFELGASYYGTNNRFDSSDLVESNPGATQQNYFAVQIPDPHSVDHTEQEITTAHVSERIADGLSQKITFGLARQDLAIDAGDNANGSYIGSYDAPYNNFTDPLTGNVYDTGQPVPVYSFPYNYYTVERNHEIDYNLRYEKPFVSAVLGATYIGQDYHEGGDFGSLVEAQTIRSVYGDAAVPLLDNRARIEAGGRVDDYSAFGTHGTYSVGATVQAIRPVTLYVNYATSFTQPTLDQLYNPAYGNASITPSDADTIEGGVRTQAFDDRLTGSATLWRSHVDNVIIYDYDIANPRVFGGFGQYANAAAEKSQGLELEAKYKLTRLVTLQGNYTYTDATTTNAAGVVSTQVEQPRNVANIGASYDNSRFSAGLNLFVTGSRLRYAADVSAAAYQRLDLFGRYHVTRHLDLYARVQNVLDQQIVEILGYHQPRLFALGGASYTF